MIAFLDMRLSMAVLLVALACGCSQTRTVTVPAGESSVQTVAPDTIEVQELPPPPPRGAVTQPEAVILYDDTTRPTFEVSLLEVDRTDPDDQVVRLRVEQGSVTVEKQLALPPVGEGIRVQKEADPDGTPTNRLRETPSGSLQETVFGAPMDYETQARVQSIERPWYTKIWMQVRLLIAFLGGGVFGYVVVKLVPGL